MTETLAFNELTIHLFLHLKSQALLTYIEPFHVNGFFLYPFETSENQWFSEVFTGYRKRPVA